MANLKEIRLRIASVKGTQKITRAMKMVAAAKLHKAQINSDKFKPYSELASSVLANVAVSASEDEHPLLERRDINFRHVLVISSDRGLCGGFNTNLNRLVYSELSSYNVPFSISVIGKKAKQFFGSRDVDIKNYYADIYDNITYDKTAEIASEMAELFISGKVDKIDIAFNSMISMSNQKPVITPLLPVLLPKDQTEDQLNNAAGMIFEPDMSSLLGTLLPRYVEIKIYGALLESMTAELAARMSAMEMATDNAQDVIDSLTLIYNRARQGAITNELMDIVGGSKGLIY
jgi:F-type H+-transporting ATPase subunit gamma